MPEVILYCTSEPRCQGGDFDNCNSDVVHHRNNNGNWYNCNSPTYEIDGVLYTPTQVKDFVISASGTGDGGGETGTVPTEIQLLAPEPLLDEADFQVLYAFTFIVLVSAFGIRMVRRIFEERAGRG